MKKPKEYQANDVFEAMKLVNIDFNKSIKRHTKKFKFDDNSQWQFRARMCNALWMQHHNCVWHHTAQELIGQNATASTAGDKDGRD